jgi:glycosyltransferase involved in cell wall biosynthesis
MRILVVSNMFPSKNYPYYGTFVKNFCKQVSEIEGTEISISVLSKQNGKFKKLYHYLKFYFNTFFKILKNNFDFVYIHYVSYSYLPVLLAANIKKINLIVNVHGSDVIPEKLSQKLMVFLFTNRALERASKIVVPSEYFKEIILEKYNLNENKITINYSGGIDLKKFYPKRNKKYVFNTTCLVIGFVSRLTHGKGWDTLLYAVKKLKIDFKLIIVGDGYEKEKFFSLIEKLNLQKKIEYHRLLDQKKLFDIYNRIDILIFPTKREGESLGLVALEAMACGTPVIASNFAAPKYYVIDGVNGYKFEISNVESLVFKIYSFYKLSLNNKNKLSNSARKTAAKFSSDESLKRLEKIFD